MNYSEQWLVLSKNMLVTALHWVVTQPGYVNSLLLKMAIEIVSFPIKNGDFP